MEFHVLTQLSLLLLPPLVYLIKHVEEDAVRRRERDVATAWGLWLMGICEGPAFGGPVPRSWSQLCFGSKHLSCHLDPCSLEHERKTKNQTKPQTYNQTKLQTQPKTQTQPKN